MRGASHRTHFSLVRSFMFLFRTSGVSEARPASPVMDAIRQGADRTGTNFDYLVKTAQRESSLDPNAKAQTSSATGLFQFIEQTWLGMVRSEGAKHGLDDAARSITQGADGRLAVADQSARDRIMALRRDPEVAATMAGAFTQRNREQLASALQREPTGGELYIAHVLGARGAQELIGAAQSSPQRVAARDFPEAAAANRGIFFDKGGRARSVSDVYNVLASAHANVAGAAAQPQAAPQAVPLFAERRGLMGLFSTEGGRRPVSDAVARLWNGQRSAGLQLASLEPSQRFFPNGDGAMAAVPDTHPSAAVPSPVHSPLPPARPAETAGDALAARQRKPRPLDLNAFLRKGVLK